MTKKAVVLLSGGLDSAVTAYVAKKDVGKTGELHILNISYGQTHSREVNSCKEIVTSLGASSLKRVNVLLNWLVASSLTGMGEIPVSPTEGIPSTWVPQRNSVFLALAFAYAESLEAYGVYMGANCRDYSGYPDCRPEFLEAMEKALNKASKRYVESGQGISLITPLLHKHKDEIIRLGVSLGVPFELTWSCYKGGEKACGVCDSCRIRLEGFKKVGLEDPLEYE